MFCKQYKKQVNTDDCENCITQRKAGSICFKRGFIWGNSKEEPMWVHSYVVAENINIDVSMYYNPDWEGNTHLKKDPLFYKIKKEGKYEKKLIPADIRWKVWERDNFTCQICGNRMYLSIDHVYPESKGGRTELCNLQTLCKPCNSRKGNKI